MTALRLRTTTGADLDFVLAAEADPEAAPFVIRWSRCEHEKALTDPDQAHLLVTDAAGPQGFVLLAGLTRAERSIELRRIVVERKGTGVGRQALFLVLEHSFDVLGADRVWLDVKPHNHRARRAYRGVGFRDERVIRDALLNDGVHEPLVVMSIGREEWAARRAGGGHPPPGSESRDL